MGPKEISALVPRRHHASVALLLAACAASRPVPSPSPSRPMAYLPRSSVAAVLAHRLDLGLDDEQVRRLEAIDDELQRQNAALANRPAPSAGSAAGPIAAPGGSAAGDARPGNASPAGEGMGRHRGGRRGASGRAAPGGKGRDPGRTADDNDTAAYFQAEQILRPEQRDRAREIAERYREELYDLRAANRPP